MSDVCSDLEEEEGGGDSHESRSTPNSWSDSDDDDDDGVNQSYLGKRKTASSRVLDSDDEDDSPCRDSEGNTKSGDDVFAAGLGMDCMEGSMPPLRLDSVDDTNSPLTPADQPSTQPGTLPAKTLTESLADSGIGQSQLQTSMNEEALAAVSEEDEEEVEGGEERRDEGSMSVVTDADSLEFSFQWGQSLPLAQPINPDAPPSVDEPTCKPSLLHADTMDMLEGEESQWQATPSKSQSLSQDPDTQFLDEDG